MKFCIQKTLFIFIIFPLVDILYDIGCTKTTKSKIFANISSPLTNKFNDPNKKYLIAEKKKT